MAHAIRALAGLAEDQAPFSAPTWWLTPTSNSSSGNPTPYSGFFQHQPCIWYTYMKTQNKKNKSLKIKSGARERDGSALVALP